MQFFCFSGTDTVSVLAICVKGASKDDGPVRLLKFSEMFADSGKVSNEDSEWRKHFDNGTFANHRSNQLREEG